MLMSTMKSVTRSAILPGTTSGLIVNDTHETTTNMRLGRYTCTDRRRKGINALFNSWSL